MKKISVYIGMAILFFLWEPHSAYSLMKKLAWDPPSEGSVTGYRIYYGTAPGRYSHAEDAGNTTEYPISYLNLADNRTWYFVVRAYNSIGESGNSNEISYEARQAELCILFNEDLSFTVPNAEFEGGQYRLTFRYLYDLYWELDVELLDTAGSRRDDPVIVNRDMSFSVSCGEYADIEFAATFRYSDGYRWELDPNSFAEKQYYTLRQNL